MVSLQVKSRVGPDGILDLQVPTGLPESEVDVLVVIQPVGNQAGTHPKGWPPGFFERTFGALRDDPLERPPQGDFEEREPQE